MATLSASFGLGSGPILLSGAGCTGNETRLTNCPSGAITGCTHAHDAGVRCSTQTGKSFCIVTYSNRSDVD